MKKKMIIAGIIFLCLFILGLCLYHGLCYKPIPLVDGLFFGVSPQRTNALFGTYIEKEENTCDTGKNTYDYQTVILGQEAQVSCSFLNDKKLSDVSITWHDCDEAFFQQVYSTLYSYYRPKNNFFENTEEMNQKGTSRITIGLNNGTTGIFYTITKSGTTVTITCIDNS